MRAGRSLTVWVAHDASDLGFAQCADFTIEPLEKVRTASEELPSPAEVTNTVRPVLITGEWREPVGCVSDEATHGVGVQTKEEGNEQVVRVPECLE